MLSRVLSGPAMAAVARWTWPGAAGAPAVEGNQAEAHSGSLAAACPAGWEAQAERRAREARQAGFREGEAAGRSQAEAQMQAEAQPVLDALARSAAEIAALRPRLVHEAQSDLVELALGIARRIVHRELAVDPEAVEGLVKAALARLHGQEICRLRTHPELEGGIRQALAKAGRGTLPLVADGTLEPGAVLLETGRGKLDASVETQLAEIGRGLADRLGS